MRFATPSALLVTAVVAVLVVPPAAAAPKKYGDPTAVVLSEVSCHDEWVELANTNLKLPVRLAGVRVAENPTDPAPKRFTFTKTAVIKAGARVLVRATALPFKIACGDERVYLLSQAGKIIDKAQPPNLADGFSWSRFGSEWRAGIPTPAGANVAVPAGSVVDRAAWMFDPMRELGIRLTIDPMDIERLVADPLTYVPAAFQMQDTSGIWQPAIPMDVGVRVKGGWGSRRGDIYGPGGLTIRDDKVSLKIKFNFSVKGQRFFGLKKLTLNNMVQDASMVHETLSYQLFRELGIIAPRTGFSGVSINGESRGLYLLLEPYDEVALAWHATDVAHLYEAAHALVETSTIVYADLNARALPLTFPVDYGDKLDTRDLAALVAAVEGTTSLSSAARALLDLDEIGAFFAVEKFINHWDGYSSNVPWAPNNYYLLSDTAGRFRMLPWGVDFTWRLVYMPGIDANGLDSLARGAGVLFGLCLTDDRCAASYRRTLAVITTLASKYQDLGSALYALHSPSRLGDKYRYFDNATSEWEMGELTLLVAARNADVTAYLTANVTGVVRWVPTTTRLTKGSTFTTAHFNAYSDVPGTFIYSDALGSKPALGKRQVTVTFTPADTSLSPSTMTIEFTIA
jgi:hypothetical protein